MAENYFWCSENRRRVICHHERLGCMQVLLLGGLIIVSTSISSDCIWIYVHVYTALQCVCVHVCLCVNSGSVDCGQKLLGKLLGKKKQVNTDFWSAISSRGYFPPKSFGGRKEMDRKKKQILKCALKKSRLKALFFSPFFLASFFAAIERSRMIVGCSCKWRGLRRVTE